MSRLESHFGTRIPWSSDRSKPVPHHFGDPTAESRALLTDVALVDFSHHETVAISGENVNDFLGGLITNQVKKVTPQKSVYSAHLTPQGRFLWDFTLLRDADRLLLITEPGSATPLAQRLSPFILRAKIRIEVESTLAMLGIAGPESSQVLQGIFPEFPILDAPLGETLSPESGIRLWRDPRHAGFGWRLLVPASAVSAWWERLVKRIPPAGFAAWEEYRIRLALPRGGNEFIPEVSLPLESGLLEMNGVDFAKGCYVGQETTARTHHRGTLKKRVYSLMLSAGEIVTPGTPILLPSGKETGVLTSVTPGTGERIGLGILHPSDVEQDRAFTIGPLQVTAQKPDWATWA
ncbi:MAG: folate-binding protein YgfZ [Magnetococcales bacterium]|nr:folate-binding protein YgfZ [Magnetococcales bacterium]